MNQHIPPPVEAPTEDDWGSESDPDACFFYRLVYGKSFEEVTRLFNDNAGERSHELLFVPRKVFQFYVHAFGQYLTSQDAVGQSDAASPFLHLLEERERRDPGSVREILESLDYFVDFVAARQAYFDAPKDIYGDFQEQAERIRRACAA
jgi:hypothetical protein